MMPNKENIRKWVEALRSGRYSQYFPDGYGYYKDGKFCALAVAKDIIINPVTPGKYVTEDEFIQTTYKVDAESYYGIQNFLIKKDGILYSFGQLNDDMKLSFNEIADLIEAQYLT